MVNKSALNGSLTFQNNSPQVGCKNEKAAIKKQNKSTIIGMIDSLINESQMKFQ
ncbi:hypothetical protein T03_15620 [Trichinella britovi]|uniref:Uncharacterized protein n=1 Tax=Trichinella britovi TaxID=45882 RepID=A0A0V0YZV6_TRIBR|nr:hypothetical protein T03_15620 [Trichinella britovi]